MAETKLNIFILLGLMMLYGVMGLGFHNLIKDRVTVYNTYGLFLDMIYWPIGLIILAFEKD